MKTKNKTAQANYHRKIIDSAVGKLTLIATDKGLAAILWEDDKPGRVRLSPVSDDENHPVLQETEKQLNEYLERKRKKFSVKLNPKGTDFQKKVWEAMLTIPFGETRTYAQIAVQIGNPKAVRAVGAAIGRNPISIIAPCHRVIGTSGKLTGFAGGLDMKETLLSLEGNHDAKEMKTK